jgi:phage terminase large subunit-like protein
MPVKLPAPVFGTEAQPAPKSVVVVAAEPPAGAVEDAIGDEAEAAGEDAEPDAAVGEPLELQAAAPMARAAASPDTARMRMFTITPCNFMCIDRHV